jgi:hypothetical protein
MYQSTLIVSHMNLSLHKIPLQAEGNCHFEYGTCPDPHVGMHFNTANIQYELHLTAIHLKYYCVKLQGKYLPYFFTQNFQHQNKGVTYVRILFCLTNTVNT